MKARLIIFCSLLIFVAGGAFAAEKNPTDIKVTRIDAAPQIMSATGVEAPANTTCDVGNVDPIAWAINGWIVGDEIYSIFADPAVCGCAGPVNPSSVSIVLNLDAAVLSAGDGAGLCDPLTMQADIRNVDWNGGLCPMPGDAILCQSLVYNVSLPAPGSYFVNIPLDPCAPISGPFFVSMTFIGPVCPEIRLVTDDFPETCNSYNDWGSGWVDLDGAGFPGKLSMFANVECAAALEAIVDIDPNTLNLKSKGKYVTCYIELPGGDPADIDVSSLLLNGVVPAEAHPTAIGDYDSDAVPDLMVKFSRSTLIASLVPTAAALWVGERGMEPALDHGEIHPMVVTGDLLDGTPFTGSDDIRIINPGGGNDDVDAGGEAVFEVYPTPVSGTAKISFELDVPGFVSLRVFDVAGRTVRTLENGHRNAGTHHVTWNRKTDDGRTAGSGVYFIKLERQGEVKMQKLLVVE